MRSLFIYITCALLLVLSACESDLLKTTIINGTSPVLTATSMQITLARADSANNALTLTWTDPKYLEDTSNGNVVGSYLIEIDKTESFSASTVISMGNELEQSYSVYKLNKLLLDMECTTDIVNDIYIRVKSVFFCSDTLISNVLKLSITPYATVIPPTIAVPAELYITGDATPGGWDKPIPDDQKFTQETSTIFTLSLYLKASSSYALITDGTGNNWTPCYRLAPTIDAASVAYGGTFVWDGDGSDYNWTTVNFVSPPSDGTYKLTFNFQDATYTLVDISGPPAITVPEALYITGDATAAAWGDCSAQQFTKVNNTTFSITIELIADKNYALITDPTGANWTPCYRLAPTDTPADRIWDGSFVWDGEGSDYGWGSKNFQAPPDDGTYTLTFDFQTATYTVAEE